MEKEGRKDGNKTSDLRRSQKRFGGFLVTLFPTPPLPLPPAATAPKISFPASTDRSPPGAGRARRTALHLNAKKIVICALGTLPAPPPSGRVARGPETEYSSPTERTPVSPAKWHLANADVYLPVPENAALFGRLPVFSPRDQRDSRVRPSTLPRTSVAICRRTTPAFLLHLAGCRLVVYGRTTHWECWMRCASWSRVERTTAHLSASPILHLPATPRTCPSGHSPCMQEARCGQRCKWPVSCRRPSPSPSVMDRGSSAPPLMCGLHGWWTGARCSRRFKCVCLPVRTPRSHLLPSSFVRHHPQQRESCAAHTYRRVLSIPVRAISRPLWR